MKDLHQMADASRQAALLLAAASLEARNAALLAMARSASLRCSADAADSVSAA